MNYHDYYDIANFFNEHFANISSSVQLNHVESTRARFSLQSHDKLIILLVIFETCKTPFLNPTGRR